MTQNIINQLFTVYKRPSKSFFLRNKEQLFYHPVGTEEHLFLLFLTNAN